jgi:molybdate transport system ATP-binding protein
MPGLSLSVKKLMHTACGDRILDIGIVAENAERIAVFGPSGAGKTTLLRMIAGLTAPDEGVITMDGEPWFDSEKKINLPPQKRHVGLVFQDYALFPAMTVEKNIAYGIRTPADGSRVRYLMEAFNLTQLCRRYPDTLSGGQQQRVALARALAPRPRVLLLDEPLSALDPAMRSALQEELSRVHRDLPVLTVLVSHDLGEIFRLTSRMFHCVEGKIIASGAPHEIFGASDDMLRITGQVLSKLDQGVVCIVTVAVGADVSRIVVLRNEAEALAVGDRVCISAKSFNPEIRKLRGT